MANTTNYNWETPDDTDLVKDGAAAIRTLGNSIDTTTKNLNPETTTGDIAYRSATANTNTRLPIGTNGQILAVSAGVPAWINNDQGDITEVQAGTGISVASGTGPIPIVTNTVATAIDAKGDLIVGTGADAFARLGVGANNTVLTADSAEATGLKWAAPAAGGGMTLLNSGNTALTGSSVTVGSIPGTYKRLIIFAENFNCASNGFFRCAPNGTTNAFVGSGTERGTATPIEFAATYIQTYQTVNSGQANNTMTIEIDDYALAAYRSIKYYGGYQIAASGGSGAFNIGGYFQNSTAITSLVFSNSAGNFTGGNVYVYGVN